MKAVDADDDAGVDLRSFVTLSDSRYFDHSSSTSLRASAASRSASSCSRSSQIACRSSSVLSGADRDRHRAADRCRGRARDDVGKISNPFILGGARGAPAARGQRRHRRPRDLEGLGRDARIGLNQAPRQRVRLHE